MEVNGSGRLFMFLKALEKEIPFTFFLRKEILFTWQLLNRRFDLISFQFFGSSHRRNYLVHQVNHVIGPPF
jgi:hypothetical protein